MQKVFIVEDAAIIRDRLKIELGAIPSVSVVGEASGAREAIAAILRANPDVVLLDLRLHEGSGYDVLSALQEAAPGIDVYILSNFASEPFRRHAARLGARGFFDKTNQFERLSETLAARAAAAAS